MKELVKFELYKIFSKKVVWILLIGCIIASLSDTVTSYLDIKSKGLTYSSIQQIGKEYEGDIITEKKVDKFEKEISELYRDYNKGKTLTDKEKVKSFGMDDYMLWVNPDYFINGKFYNFDGMKKELNKLEKEGASNTYEYKELKYIHDLVAKKSTPKYYFKFGWREATDFNINCLFMAILILVSICTIFSNEYQSNTVSIVLSSKNGKKNLTKAKVIAGIIFSTFVFLVMNGIQIIILAIHGFKGWNLPMSFLQSYVRTPYDINIGTLYICGLIVSFIGILLFTLLIMLASLISKNNLVSLALGIAILLGPDFIGRFMPTYNLTKVFAELNIAKLIGPSSIFSNISTYNIFENPVLYLNVIITIAIVSIPIVLYFINRLGKKQVVQ
ncbi:hypothetical protein [Paraclostridium bifermentans]|uniref:hypothetical protein n=1 Tax=Paraclostridium bifermentans TaxID=1490 RepID=UPI00359C9B8D